MSERLPTNMRTRPPGAGTSGAQLGVSVSMIDGVASYVLRIDPRLVETMSNAAGFDLTGRINTAIATGDQIAARLGPDEWLLTAPASKDDALGSAIGTALAGHFHSVLDVSHRNVAIAVAGPEASIVLNAGVALDLDDRAFPAGSATRTVLGKAEIVLVRAGAEHFYRVECWRSFAPYVREFLEEASREFIGS